MPKLFNSKQAGIIITVLILIFLGASYFFIYVPENEKTVQERRFRTLQDIDSNIHFKIDNSTSLINNLLYTNKTDINGTKSLVKRYNDSLSKYYKNKADYQLVAGELPGHGHLRSNFTKTFIDSLVDDQVVVDAADNRLTIYASYTSDKRANAPKIGIQFAVDQFVKPLLPANVFDNYVVFDDTGKIFETFRSGLNYKIRDSLLNTTKGISVPGLHDIQIGGTQYKLFAQPVTVLDQKWIVVGLVTSKNYQKEKNQLPLWIVLLLLTAAIGIVVCIPWVKLYHMGGKDKLTIRDGIATVLVSMILMSLLSFVFFKYNFRFIILREKPPTDPKEVLANNISTAFENELHNAYNVLSNCDSIFTKTYPNISETSRKAGRDSLGNLNLKNIGYTIDVHQVFWVNLSDGREIYNWATDVNIPKGTDVNTRDYFINIKNNRPNRIQGRDTFYVGENISKATGVFTTAIAKKSRQQGTMVGMALTIQSLDTVILPDGYQFALIDENGEVRYHSQSQFNLNQNLKTEFSDSSALVSCLEAKSNSVFPVEYFGKRYNVKIKPLLNLPYYITVMEDLEYSDTRDMEAYAFTLSMLLCLLVFLIIEVSVVFLSSSRQSFFKKQYFETSWIGPKTSSHGIYNLAILVNLFIIGMMSFYFGCAFTQDAFLVKSSFLEYIYIILFSITLTSLALNTVFFKKYKRENCYKHKYKLRAIISSAALIVLIDLAAGSTLDLKNGSVLTSHFAYLLYYEAITIGFCLATVHYLPRLLTTLDNLNQVWRFNWNYTNSFAMMATTRLIITSGIPVAFFFMYSYDYEQNLDTRYRQYHFARDFVASQNVSGSTPNKDILQKSSDYTAGVYFDGVSVVNIGVLDSPDTINSLQRKFRYRFEDSLSASILSTFRFHVNDIETKNNLMNLPSVANDAFFNKLTREKSNDSVSTSTYYRLNPAKYLVIYSANTDYKSPNWLLLLPALLFFYFIMHNVIRKLFALNLPGEDGWKEINEGLLTDNKLNKLLLIVGAPGSGKLSNLKDALKKHVLLGNKGERLIYDEDRSKSNVFIADMIVIPAGSADCGNDATEDKWAACVEEALNDQYSLVIINHLEYNMKDGKTNNMKLDMLEKLMTKAKSKIMIISTVHPVSFLDSYNQQIKQANKDTADDASDTKPENELERWMVLFGHFRIIIEPLEDSHVKTELPVIKEIQYSHFLKNMERIIPEEIAHKAENIGPETDSMIFKLQLTSQYFYTYIWQSLTMEEKFLLYDLAEDGLVNSYDAYNLSILISKKLVVISDGTLMLFNKGFRNFILTAIGETEANRIKAHVKADGNWDSLKIPLMLIMLAILAFLFASQQEAYSRIITYITAFSAGIPAILKVFSLFGNSSQKSA